MEARQLTRAAVLALLVGGVACAQNKSEDQVGAAQDSTMTAKVDSTPNQTESGVTDSTGQSTLGKGAEQTRPDQGQPVTAKGDTINQGVDSASAGAPGHTGAAYDSTSANTVSDSTANGAAANGAADSTMNQTESGVTDSTGQSTLGKSVEQTRPDQGQPVTAKGDTLNQGVDSASTQR